MKSDRQIAILELIGESSIETQEELAKALRNRGLQVTQATVSCFGGTCGQRADSLGMRKSERRGAYGHFRVPPGARGAQRAAN